MFINCGARLASNGERIPTKNALKQALATQPGAVVFDETALFKTVGDIYGDQIPPATKLVVTGPDPYAKRTWYAIVEAVGGKIKVT